MCNVFGSREEIMKRVLIIDDKCYEEEESIRQGFEGTGIEYSLSATKDDALRVLESKALFDCVVLDWYLEPNDSTLSQLILKYMEQNYYAPVLIYSNHAVDFRAAKDVGEITYPDNLIHIVEKEDYTDIHAKVEHWLANDTTAKLSSIYLERVYKNLHKTFWELNEIPNSNIAGVYKDVLFENGVVNWGHDFVMNLLLQNLIGDASFRSEITTLIETESSTTVASSAEEKQKIVNRILYFDSNTPFVQNGDIFRVSTGEGIEYGIVVSPDCDLAQSKTRFIDFVELRELDESLGKASLIRDIKNNKSDGHFFFLGMQLDSETYTNMAAVFKSKSRVSCLADHTGKYPCVDKRLEYTDDFLYNGEKGQLAYICSIANPYKAEFAQKRSAHDSRVGIPSIYKYVSD